MKRAANIIWPWWVRVSHWLVAAGVIALWLMSYFWYETDLIHRLTGYIVFSTVLCRLLLGFVTCSQAARFFWPDLVSIRTHVAEFSHGKITPHKRHNPLGQLAVYCMWTLIAGLALTGWLSRTDALWGEDWPVDLHTFLSYCLMGLVCVHIIAVFWLSKLSGQDLLAQMINGQFAWRKSNSK